MLKIGITGQNGFIGYHLHNTLGLYPQNFEQIRFERKFFDNNVLLDEFVSQCDVIVHLAGLNRHNDPEVIQQKNVELAQKLIDSFNRTKHTPRLVFASSTQEETDTLYGKSKKQARLLFNAWAQKSKASFTGLIIPNVFGPFGNPFYNSFIATFCHQLVHNEMPAVDNDREIQLIYVGELVKEIIDVIESPVVTKRKKIRYTTEVKISGVLTLLKKYKTEYLENGRIPEISNRFELNLFNTFRSCIDLKSTYPVNLNKHMDDRGVFSEIIRLGKGGNGQISFSTTLQGAVRGNHFHTRKIERFTVIKGEALIQLRRIGSAETFDFYLSGEQPSYIDMPIWTAHNIKNIGSEDLYTIFWINEQYDAQDPDTYFEVV